MTASPIENSRARLEFWLETLMEETKTVITEKHQFENRVESIILSFSGIFELSGLRCKALSE